MSPDANDYSGQWRAILARHALGRRRLVLHLVLAPALIYLVGFLVAKVTGSDPVWFYVAAFVAWIVTLVVLIQRFEPYACPRCGTRVLPSGAVSLLPLPCSKCGLTLPLHGRAGP